MVVSCRLRTQVRVPPACSAPRSRLARTKRARISEASESGGPVDRGGPAAGRTGRPDRRPRAHRAHSWLPGSAPAAAPADVGEHGRCERELDPPGATAAVDAAAPSARPEEAQARVGARHHALEPRRAAVGDAGEAVLRADLLVRGARADAALAELRVGAVVADLAHRRIPEAPARFALLTGRAARRAVARRALGDGDHRRLGRRPEV